MKTTIINFIAAPCSGKSLMASYLFATLKSMHYNAEYVQEFAKFLIYQERFDELNDQYNVSQEQYKMIKSINGKVEYITTDSPLILGLYYNRHFKNNKSDILKTENMILEKNAEFNNIYIFLTRNMDYDFINTGRVHNEEQSKIIEKELKLLIDNMGLKYLEVKSDISNINIILEYIKTFEKKNN
jgi:hypothetical protein